MPPRFLPLIRQQGDRARVLIQTESKKDRRQDERG